MSSKARATWAPASGLGAEAVSAAQPDSAARSGSVRIARECLPCAMSLPRLYLQSAPGRSAGACADLNIVRPMRKGACAAADPSWREFGLRCRRRKMAHVLETASVPRGTLLSRAARQGCAHRERLGAGASARSFRIPRALPDIMAGVDRTIMMPLAMVVIASLVPAPGLGALVPHAAVLPSVAPLPPGAPAKGCGLGMEGRGRLC